MKLGKHLSQAAAAIQKVELDLSVKRRVGEEVGDGEPIEPCSASDIRRWVMAMDYFNPIHWDDQFARNSKFGGLTSTILPRKGRAGPSELGRPS